MKIPVCICLSLVLTSPQFALAGKKSGGGGGAAHAGAAAHAGHLGGGGAAHLGSAGAFNRAGAGQQNFHSNSIHNAGQLAHAQHGLNAQHGLSAQHGLNSHHQMAGHGLNAHNGSFQNNHSGKFSGNHWAGNHFAAHNHLAGHWRSGLHWRNCHALYAGYHRVWHDHWWWRGHYSNVVFVDGPYWGGNWYWDGGYWFPAWGYDPGYVAYVYDGPIFAYDNLPPDEVVVSVQEALQDQGYYSGDIDGQFGAKTRDALAAYQRDHSLDVTAAIDEPTVQALGLTTEAAA